MFFERHKDVCEDLTDATLATALFFPHSRDRLPMRVNTARLEPKFIFSKKVKEKKLTLLYLLIEISMTILLFFIDFVVLF